MNMCCTSRICHTPFDRALAAGRSPTGSVLLLLPRYWRSSSRSALMVLCCAPFPGPDQPSSTPPPFAVLQRGMDNVLWVIILSKKSVPWICRQTATVGAHGEYKRLTRQSCATDRFPHAPVHLDRSWQSNGSKTFVSIASSADRAAIPPAATTMTDLIVLKSALLTETTCRATQARAGTGLPNSLTTDPYFRLIMPPPATTLVLDSPPH